MSSLSNRYHDTQYPQYRRNAYCPRHHPPTRPEGDTDPIADPDGSTAGAETYLHMNMHIHYRAARGRPPRRCVGRALHGVGEHDAAEY